MLDHLARLTWRHARAVLVAIVAFAAVAGWFGHDVEHHLKAAGFTDPGSQSEQADGIVGRALGYSGTIGEVILVRGPGGRALDVTDQSVQTEVARIVAAVSKAAYVGRVINPLAAGRSGAPLLARDGRSLILPVFLTGTDLEDRGGKADIAIRVGVGSSPLTVGYGGFAPSFSEVNNQTRRDLTRAELLAFPALTVLLLFVFRSAVAAALPLAVGVLSIVGTLFGLRLMSELVDTSLFALNITTAMGLGLAVDYALLMVSRYREELNHGATFEQAHRRTVVSAGRTVLFSGSTVAAAMAALALMPQRFLYSVGLAGAMVGIFSAATAVLVVPALLAVLGPRLDRFTVRRGAAVSDISQGWLRLARGVMRHPAAACAVTATALLCLAGPVFGTTLTGPSAQAVPRGQQSYSVNRYVNAHYGRAVTEGVTLTLVGPTSASDLAAVSDQISRVPHVAQLSPFLRVNADLALATAALDQPALTGDSQAAVRAMRKVTQPSDVRLLLGGNTARFIDQKSSLLSHAPMVIGVIVLLTLALLFLLTGSVLLPLKTLLMNSLTLAATLGLLVIVFVHRLGAGLIDYPGPYAIEVTSLVFLFAVTFALATDYAILVMARIKELRDSGLSNEEAVVQGMARTGRIISAAALMIAVVFLAFAVSPVFFMKQISVGMAVAVLVDATVVRALLVPSLLKLLGEANWWAPAPLRRFHNRFGIGEG
jgi:uncharacterized membrane protein YdfJ with MMPL/SSD domain